MTDWLWQISFGSDVLQTRSGFLVERLFQRESPGLPWSVRVVQQNFSIGQSNGWFLVCAITFVLLVSIAVLVFWIKNRKGFFKKPITNPYELFAELLKEVQLNADDKKFLHELASGARLRHPAQCLLSPGLLGWAGRLWQMERDRETIDAEVISRINAISIKLYEHAPISSRE